MNLERLYEFQKKLDGEIKDKLSDTEKSLLPKKLLAFQAKIGELATETQCFKFWLPKKSPVKRKTLEKYIECLYLVLSIGVEKNYTETEFEIKQVEYNLTDQFLNLFIDMNDFMVYSSKDSYITLIEDLLSLSLTLGFSESDIVKNSKEFYSA